jgi:hypothetical protein
MNNHKRFCNWITINLDELSKLNDRTGIEILNNCGKACCETSMLYQGACKIRNFYAPETNIDTLFNDFKKEYYNSDTFIKKGKTISLTFNECTCFMVKNGVNNPFLCNCTIGYSKRLFETLFEREVSVYLEKSILRGDRVCMQKIKIS